MSVLITRPAHQAKPFVDLLKANGCRAECLPVMQIEACSDAQQRIEINMRQQWHSFIFVSVNAANIGLALLASFRTELERAELFCIGPSTQRAVAEWLNDPAKTVHCSTAPYRSESLLKLPALQAGNLADKNILIINGENGRDYLADKLTELGACITSCSVYRRTAVKMLSVKITELKYNPVILTAMSGDTIKLLTNAIDDAKLQSWFNKPIIVPGDRVARLARELGFNNVVKIDYPSPQLLLETINFMQATQL